MPFSPSKSHKIFCPYTFCTRELAVSFKQEALQLNTFASSVFDAQSHPLGRVFKSTTLVECAEYVDGRQNKNQTGRKTLVF